MTELGEARQRRHQRIEMEVEVIVRTDSALLPGRTQDSSESGMSAILPVELFEGQEVELQIRLRGPLRPRERLCEIAMSIVMALNSCSHCTGF